MASLEDLRAAMDRSLSQGWGDRMSLYSRTRVDEYVAHLEAELKESRESAVISINATGEVLMKALEENKRLEARITELETLLTIERKGAAGESERF